MTGTITELHRARGTGFVRGEDGKMYLFRRHDLRDCWFHDLTEGAAVTFEPHNNTLGLYATSLTVSRSA